MTVRQCKSCPWRKGVDARGIPDGYCAEKHARLGVTTIAKGLASFSKPLRFMACHSSPRGHEKPCAGWLANQLAPGEHLALQWVVWTERPEWGDLELIGEQHACFEDTIPKEESL